MSVQEIMEVLESVGAVITDSHIVYTSGKHGTTYVNKDAVYPHTKETSRLCRALAEKFAHDAVDVVVAPAVGGVILSQWTAHHLSEFIGREVLGVYAERNEKSIVKADNGPIVTHEVSLCEDDELVYRTPHFVVKRGYDKLVAGRNVLVVEDVLTTGGSARKVVEATRALKGNVVGLGVLCNRGGVKPHDVADVPKLLALVNVTLDAWDEGDCPLCKQGVPVNTDVGKGRDFLARRRSS